MKSLVEDQAQKKAVFNFYNTYLSVVYGLLVTDGLHYLVAYISEPEKMKLFNSVKAFLLAGTLLTAFHFWYVCATVDDLAQDCYRIVAETNTAYFDLLVLFDAVIATVFAGLVLAMFEAIPQNNERLFFWFLCGAVLSLLYDFGSSLVVLHGGRAQQEERHQQTIHKYGRKIIYWTTGDVIFLGVSAAMYFLYHSLEAKHSVALASAFAVFTVFLLLSDVDLWTFGKVRGRSVP